jgi:hypothetical protein
MSHGAGATCVDVEMKTIGVSDMSDAKEVKQDHVKVPVGDRVDDELEALLHTDTRRGLTTAEVDERLLTFGTNGK